MKTRLCTALWASGLTATVSAQSGPSEPSTPEIGQIAAALPYVSVIVVAAVYAGLFKAFSRFGGAQPWLVAAALFALPLLAVDGFRLIVFMPGFYQTPIRASVLFWSVISGLLAVAWWFLKTRTRWLDVATKALPMSSPRGDGDAPAPSRAEAATAAHPPVPPTPARHSVLVFYRRQDSADVTGRIYDRLVQRFAREQIFKDVDSIPLGVDFRAHLEGVVGRCTLLLAVIGPGWLSAAGANGRRIDDSADFVRIEIEGAESEGLPCCNPRPR